MSAEIDMATHLATGLVALTYNANCRYGPVQEPDANQSVSGAIPDECVFVQATGGPGMNIYRGSLPSADAPWLQGDRTISIQVYVRSGKHAYTAGRALVDSIHAYAEGNPPAGYYDLTAIDEPIYIREDETNHHEWSINYRLKKHHAAP